jgi:hypothetical protein
MIVSFPPAIISVGSPLIGFSRGATLIESTDFLLICFRYIKTRGCRWRKPFSLHLHKAILCLSLSLLCSAELNKKRELNSYNRRL